MTYFFCYDVVDAHRRNKISKILEKYGLRVQKSIFQCDILPLRAHEIKEAILSILTENEDSLLFYSVCDDCVKEALLIGDKSPLQDVGFEIL